MPTSILGPVGFSGGAYSNQSNAQGNVSSPILEAPIRSITQQLDATTPTPPADFYLSLTETITLVDAAASFISQVNLTETINLVEVAASLSLSEIQGDLIPSRCRDFDRESPVRLAENLRMYLKPIFKQPAERLTPTISFENNTFGGSVSSVTATAREYDTDTVVTGTLLSGSGTLSSPFFTPTIIGGTSGKTYIITITATMSGGQIIQDELPVVVQEL